MGKEEELATIQIQLDQQKSDLHAAQTALKTKEEEQALLQLQLTAQADALASQEIRLGAMQEALSSQQRQLDDLLGVRTAIIQDLSGALTQAAVGAKVDKTTGDIILDSQLAFESGATPSPSGHGAAAAHHPMYLVYWMREEYRTILRNYHRGPHRQQRQLHV